LIQAPEGERAPILEAAVAALDRHEWRTAFDGLSAADAQQPLSPAGLELLATAAWWTGQLPVAIEIRERAFAEASKAGDMLTAVEVAINLARDHVFKLAMPTATTWVKRAEKMLEGLEENQGHGWVAGVKATIAAVGGDNEESIAQATLAQEIAQRVGAPDLLAFAMAGRAAGLMARGDVEEGLALADEAATAAITGELQPAVAGSVFCATIEACAGIGDVRRALEWTEAQDRWCRREHINGFPGMCRIFRSDVKRMHGAWPEAEAEALQASVELRGYIPGAAGLALYQIGEIRLRRGDLPAAEEALLGAHGLGQDTEPALSLLRLAQGKTAVAAESIRRALNEPGRPSWRAPSDSAMYRVMLLPAQVEILLAAGDVAGARASADELAALADKFQTPSVLANSASANGLVALAEGKAYEATTHLRQRSGCGWAWTLRLRQPACDWPWPMPTGRASPTWVRSRRVPPAMPSSSSAPRSTCGTPRPFSPRSPLRAPRRSGRPRRASSASSCSLTSSTRPGWPRPLGTRRGTALSAPTTRRSVPRLLSRVGRRSRPRAMAVVHQFELDT
jgi:tetratricopeptide (TPR) repeat protein